MKGERLCLDRISTLPSPIIENVLCRVPIKDAARTSILSRNWRYNWLTIPKLEFIEKDFEIFIKTTDEDELLEPNWSPSTGWKQTSKRCKLFAAMKQVMLVYKGPIDEFALHMDAVGTCYQIDQIILYLSKNSNSLKKFTLKLQPCARYHVPVSIFSLHGLTDLYLSHCIIDYDPTKFNGFGSLTTLSLHDVNASSEEFLHMSSSPLLKSLTLTIVGYYFKGMEDLGIHELFKCLLVIEHLTISYRAIMYFGIDAVPRDLPTSLVHLKSVYLKYTCFSSKYALLFLLLLIRYSPNLGKIKLQMDRNTYYWKNDETNSVLLEVLSDVAFEHLKELEIVNFKNRKLEMEFVKLILAKSPVLKKVTIWHNVSKDKELKMVKSLLRGPHISPVVDIFVERNRQRTLASKDI